MGCLHTPFVQQEQKGKSEEDRTQRRIRTSSSTKLVLNGFVFFSVLISRSVERRKFLVILETFLFSSETSSKESWLVEPSPVLPRTFQCFHCILQQLQTSPHLRTFYFLRKKPWFLKKIIHIFEIVFFHEINFWEFLYKSKNIFHD